MVVVKDLDRDSGSVDTAIDLDKGIAVGFSDVGGTAAVVGKGQLALEESARDVVTTELELLLVSSLDGSG